MRLTRWSGLLLVAAVTGVGAYAVLRALDSRGTDVPQVSAVVWLVLALLAAVVLALGWNVRQHTHGKRRGLDPLVAARTVVLAKAACYTGALLTGWYGAQVAVFAFDLANEPRRDRALAAAVATLCALLLAVAGLIAERFCQVPPPGDDDRDAGGGSAPTGASGTAAA